MKHYKYYKPTFKTDLLYLIKISKNNGSYIYVYSDCIKKDLPPSTINDSIWIDKYYEEIPECEAALL